MSEEPTSELYTWALVYMKLLNCIFFGLDVMMLCLWAAQK
jgi:hypothetical protein